MKWKNEVMENNMNKQNTEHREAKALTYIYILQTRISFSRMNYRMSVELLLKLEAQSELSPKIKKLLVRLLFKILYYLLKLSHN
jgi:hypothetical protein